jgi:MipA family protein
MKISARCHWVKVAALLVVTIAAPGRAADDSGPDDGGKAPDGPAVSAPDARVFGAVPVAISNASHDLAVMRQDGPVQDGPVEDTGAQQPARVARTGGPPQGMPSVFDDNWLNVGFGLGLVPTYGGSDNYFVFPVPLVTGRIGGVGFRPAGAGVVFDVLSPQPTVLQNNKAPRLSIGPTFRVRVDRSVDPRDDAVAAAGELDNAIELGIAGGVTFPALLNPNDSLTVTTAVRWDVAGAHKGRVIEPTVAYLTPLSLGILVQLSATMEFVDDRFARYYFNVSPAQSAASGLPVFNGSGGANRIGTNLTAAFDLDGNALNGGFNVFTIAGYSRMLGDGAANPFTAVRGNPNQFLIGAGVGYTF